MCSCTHYTTQTCYNLTHMTTKMILRIVSFIIIMAGYLLAKSDVFTFGTNIPTFIFLAALCTLLFSVYRRGKTLTREDKKELHELSKKYPFIKHHIIPSNLLEIRDELEHQTGNIGYYAIGGGVLQLGAALAFLSTNASKAGALALIIIPGAILYGLGAFFFAVLSISKTLECLVFTNRVNAFLAQGMRDGSIILGTPASNQIPGTADPEIWNNIAGLIERNRRRCKESLILPVITLTVLGITLVI